MDAAPTMSRVTLPILSTPMTVMNVATKLTKLIAMVPYRDTRAEK